MAQTCEGYELTGFQIMRINNPTGPLLCHMTMEDDAQLLPGHFEMQSYVSVNWEEDGSSRKFLGGMLPCHLVLDDGFWPPVESLDPPDYFYMPHRKPQPLNDDTWAQAGPGTYGFPPPPPVSTRPVPATPEPGTWPAATRWFWQQKRFKMSSLAQKHPVFSPAENSWLLARLFLDVMFILWLHMSYKAET